MGWGDGGAGVWSGWAWRVAGVAWEGMGGTGRGEDRETAHRRRGPGTEGTARKEAVGGPWKAGAAGGATCARARRARGADGPQRGGKTVFPTRSAGSPVAVPCGEGWRRHRRRFRRGIPASNARLADALAPLPFQSSGGRSGHGGQGTGRRRKPGRGRHPAAVVSCSRTAARFGSVPFPVSVLREGLVLPPPTLVFLGRCGEKFFQLERGCGCRRRGCAGGHGQR